MSATQPAGRVAAFVSDAHPHSEYDDFRTPDFLFQYVNRAVCRITHDGACSLENALAIPLRLEDEWPSDAGIWINPPWDMESIVKWALKARATADAGSRVVMLLPNKLTDTRFQREVGCVFDHLQFIGGRINFSGPYSTRTGGASRWGCFIGTMNCSPAPGAYSFKLLRDIRRESACS